MALNWSASDGGMIDHVSKNSGRQKWHNFVKGRRVMVVATIPSKFIRRGTIWAGFAVCSSCYRSGLSGVRFSFR